MSETKKLVHIQVVDASVADIETLRGALNIIKKDLPYEFLITNDSIQVHDVSKLLKELIILYRREEAKLKSIRDETKKLAKVLK